MNLSCIKNGELHLAKIGYCKETGKKDRLYRFFISVLFMNKAL